MRSRLTSLTVWLGIGLTASAWSFAVEYHNPDLPSLLTFNNGTAVTTPEQWTQRRAEVLTSMEDTFIGTFPQQAPSIIGSQILSRTVAPDGSTRSNIRLTFNTPHQASFDMWVWTPQGNQPHPLLLTAPRYYQLNWANAALARGYSVCLYPGLDQGQTEAAYPGYDTVWNTFRSEYPTATWSEIGTKAWLAGRALDYVLNPSSGFNIATNQVAITGHSRYGKQALVAAAIDQRFTAVVARSAGSPGSAPYRFSSRTGFDEAPSEFGGQWFKESLRSYTGREDQLPMDAHAWAALIAPRNLLMDTAYYDDGDPTYAVERGYYESSKVYSLLGAEDHCRVDYRDGWHDPYASGWPQIGGTLPLSTVARIKRNIDWLDASFGRGTATKSEFPQEYLFKFDWNAWQAKLTPQEKQNPFAGTLPQNNADRRARIDWALGQAPAKTPFTGQRTFYTAEQSAQTGHDRWSNTSITTRVPVSFGNDVHGNIYYQKGRTTPAPVVIWLHPYSYATGYGEAYGVENTTIYDTLAQHGYTVLCFDQVGFGQRLLEGRDFYQNNPKGSKLGRMIADVHSAVDFLVDGVGAAQGAMPMIDKNQIHLLGYSMGGMVGLYSAATDSRIKSVASFAGFTPMRTNTADKPTGGLDELWQWHSLQPMLGLFDGHEAQLPYDFQDVLALVAPRPTLLYTPQQDRFADYADVSTCINGAKTFWQQAGYGNYLTWQSPNDISRLQSAQQDAYLQWLGNVVHLPAPTPEPSVGALLITGLLTTVLGYAWRRWRPSSREDCRDARSKSKKEVSYAM
jgi:pimeloyl-ACP methyl ester carboxylesterase